MEKVVLDSGFAFCLLFECILTLGSKKIIVIYEGNQATCYIMT